MLCHDDDIGSESDGRRIAFIFYLVEADWGQKDGGDLSLFDCDVNGDPDSIATSIRPVRGQFSFFQVSGTSHHQVEQVVGSRERVSISGWFHGPKQVGIPAPFGQDGDCVPILSEWINPAYLKNSNMQMIQSKMARDSFLQLQMFLDTALYDALVKAMEQTEFDRLDGPANQRRSHSPSLVLCKNDILSEFKHFISCKPFLWFLQQVTSLELVHSRAQITAFMPGDYTLMNDKTVLPPGLDVLFSMPRNTSKWQDEWGGGTHYVAEQETLLSVYPQTNTLNIVLRDADTLRFVKLVSKTCPAQRVDVDLTLLLAQE